MTTTITDIHVAKNGTVYVRFGKLELEFASIEAARQHANTAAIGTADGERALVIKMLLDRDPTLSRKADFIGRDLVVDTTSDQPITLREKTGGIRG